jgi:hypothetical protein
MKGIRILMLAVASLVISVLIYYITDGVIRSSWGDIIGEICTTAVILFVVLLLIYIIARSAAKKAIAARKKSLPNQEGPKP